MSLDFVIFVAVCEWSTSDLTLHTIGWQNDLKKRRTYVEIDGVWPIDTSKYIDIDRFEVARIAVYIIQMRA